MVFNLLQKFFYETGVMKFQLKEKLYMFRSKEFVKTSELFRQERIMKTKCCHLKVIVMKKVFKLFDEEGKSWNSVDFFKLII